MAEAGIRRNQIIRELVRSSHGKLTDYVKTGRAAAHDEPEFLAHLIAWNEKKGTIRDSKIALPIVSLSEWGTNRALSGDAGKNGNAELIENSLAHLAKQDPRTFVRALRFGKEIGVAGRSMRRLVERYVRVREAKMSWWERTVLQHRKSMRTLYGMYHIAPGGYADSVFDRILMKNRPPAGTLLGAIRELPRMAPGHAATTIREKKIPFLIVIGAIGGRLKAEDDLAVALIESMSPTELVTNTKLLERVGLSSRPALRAAFDEGVKKVAESKKTTFKATAAVEKIASEPLKKKLKAVQEKQIDALGKVDGNWLVLGDRSSSMTSAIRVSMEVAAALAKAVSGEVHLVFFNTSPIYKNVTGKTYEEIRALCKAVSAAGLTSIGCGLDYALRAGFDLNGIAIVTDGQENSYPTFVTTYKSYVEKFGAEPTVYVYRIQGDRMNSSLEESLDREQVAHELFDLDKMTVDRESLAQLILTMRASRYALADEILETPLLTLDAVFA